MGDLVSKKEYNKKKVEKRKLKQQRRENRKTDNNKGKTFEEMLIYVDKSGHLSKVPQNDPNHDDAALHSFQEDQNLDHKTKRKGIVISFFTEKGYGFIKDQKSGTNIFFHILDILEDLMPQDKVLFIKQKTVKGSKAVRVEKR